MPDRYSLPKIKISIQFKGFEKWEEICSGVFKPLFDEEIFYQISFPIIGIKTPEMLRLEVWGYGGQEFRFVEILNSHFRYVPKTVVKTEGIVLDAEHLLFDDYRWSYLGEHDVFRTFHTPGLENTRHIIELFLNEDKRQIGKDD